MMYTITGQPVVLKNNKRIVKFGKHTRLIPSSKVLKAEKLALIELKNQMIQGERGAYPITGKLHIKFTFYGAWKDGNSNVPDLSNLYEAPQDWLQKAGIIEDDRQIESHDGSRRICMCPTCPKRLTYKRGERAGQYKDDCGAVKKCIHERTVIEISRYEQEVSFVIDPEGESSMTFPSGETMKLRQVEINFDEEE